MGKGSSAPDPYQTANAQVGMNYQNAQQNMGFQNMNQITPQGSQTYTQSGWNPIYNQSGQITGYSPRYTSTIKLSPAEEALRLKNQNLRGLFADTAMTQGTRLAKLLSKDLSTSGLTPWTTTARPGAIRQDQGVTDREGIQTAMMRMFDRDAVKQNAADDAQAFARGLAPGGASWSRMVQGRNDARTNALDQAYLRSGDESRAAQAAYNAATQQKYSLGEAWSNAMNNQRQRELEERMALRANPFKETLSLFGLSGPETPTFTPFGGTSMPGVNLGDMIYNSAAINRQNQSDMFSGGASILSAIAGAIPWSDRRLKRSIKPVGRNLAGVPLYRFRYKKHIVIPPSLQDVWRTGVMADEARLVHPDAVTRGADGYDRVNYELLYKREASHG